MNAPFVVFQFFGTDKPPCAFATEARATWLERAIGSAPHLGLPEPEKVISFTDGRMRQADRDNSQTGSAPRCG